MKDEKKFECIFSCIQYCSPCIMICHLVGLLCSCKERKSKNI